MEEFKNKLDQDEIIVWEKSKVKNYFYLPQIIITISIVYAIIITIAIIFHDILIYLLTLGFIAIMSIGIISDVKNYMRRKRDLKLSHKELKYYESFYILTNKRLIERQINYRESFSFYTEGSFNKIADMRFLILKSVNLIIVQRLKNVIYFYTENYINEFSDTDYFIERLDPYLYLRGTINIYCKKDQNQLEKAFTALNSILSLERIFQNQNGEIYAIKGKNLKINLKRNDNL